MQNFVRLCSFFTLCAFCTLSQFLMAAEFQHEPLPEKTVIQYRLESKLAFSGYKAPKVQSELEREVYILNRNGDNATKIKVVYGDGGITSTLDGVDSYELPVAGGTYLVEGNGKSDSKISTLIKNENITDEEKSFIEYDFALFGQVHPISQMLNGQKLQIGQEPASTTVLKNLLEMRFKPFGIGEITNLNVIYAGNGSYLKDKTAIFALNVKTGSSSTYPDLSFNLSGELVVSQQTGRPIGIQLRGPVKANVPLTPGGKKSSATGTFSMTIQTNVFKGEEVDKWYGNNPWGTGVIVRPPRPALRR